jgi:hypothetical protein
MYGMTVLDPADFTDCHIGYDESWPEAVLYDSRSYSRGKARSYHAKEYGLEFTEVKVATAYARWLTLDEQWEETGRDRWPDHQDYDDVPPVAPEKRPADWEPGEYDWALALCKRTTPGAVKVWRCEVPQ